MRQLSGERACQGAEPRQCLPLSICPSGQLLRRPMAGFCSAVDTEFHTEPLPSRYMIVRDGKLVQGSLRYHRVGSPSQVPIIDPASPCPAALEMHNRNLEPRLGPVLLGGWEQQYLPNPELRRTNI